MSALKRVAGVSLYHQIMEDLREEIQGMAYGEQIETEQQLAEKYAVSRGTVRQAITALVSEGLLTKIQGKGTFKSGVALDRSTAVVKSFTDQLLASGLVPGIRDVNLESDFADERTAKHLGLAPARRSGRLSRVRLADGVPISYCTAYINPAYATGLCAGDLEMSLIAMFTEKLGVPLQHGESFGDCDAGQRGAGAAAGRQHLHPHLAPGACRLPGVGGPGVFRRHRLDRRAVRHADRTGLLRQGLRDPGRPGVPEKSE